MIEILNRLVDEIEQRLHIGVGTGPGSGVGTGLDIDGLAAQLGTTAYRARRMFSSLAGIPVSEYVRRRRMPLEAADLLGDENLFTIAVRCGYSSTEAFGRAFRALHGTSHGAVRRHSGPLQSQPLLRFRLAVEGGTPWMPESLNAPASS